MNELHQLCRVCHKPVKPWRRGWRRPTITIHQNCLMSLCRFCGALFWVNKERTGQFCCEAHHQAMRQRETDQRHRVVA